MACAKYRIRIMKNGPYIVTGGAPLRETIITPEGEGYEFRPGRALPQAQSYALCRCGRSAKAPFCDGAHAFIGFDGTETASREPYYARAERIEGKTLDLLDDGRCAFARFCHRNDGTAWELVETACTQQARAEAIRAATECPSGRLTSVEKDGAEHELDCEPGIEIMQDPEREVSAFIFVKGGIPIEAGDGAEYEIRNRVALCRCGRSQDKPYCDATHVVIEYRDK